MIRMKPMLCILCWFQLNLVPCPNIHKLSKNISIIPVYKLKTNFVCIKQTNLVVHHHKPSYLKFLCIIISDRVFYTYLHYAIRGFPRVLLIYGTKSHRRAARRPPTRLQPLPPGFLRLHPPSHSSHTFQANKN